MRRVRKYLIFILVILSGTYTYGQGNDSINQVKVIGRAKEKSILLRWASTDPVSWQLGNKYGYMVERFTIIRDKKILDNPEKIRLTTQPLKPGTQPAWEKIIDDNDYAAIAAQAIYGESFEVTQSKSSSMMEMIAMAKEVEQRFSFALFAADHSFDVAKLSGLALEDSTAVRSEKYLYRVFINVPLSVAKIDTGSVFIGLQDHAPLAKPADVSAHFGDRVVLLRWPVKFLNKVYVSYIIERSDDENKNYQSIGDHPFINTEDNNLDPDFFTKYDTLPDNTKTYYYRIRGITSFGETGPPSDVVKGSGRHTIKCDIGIKDGREIPNNKIKLTWQDACEGNQRIDGFQLVRASNINGVYTALHKEPIIHTLKTFVDEAPLATNYYKVSILVNGQAIKTSLPYLVQLADSIPPAVPLQLQASIDTLGVVKLSWKGNQENDLLGYRVFRSNFESSEYSQLTVSPIRMTTFYDTINLKTLTKKIFYKITAEDTRHNRSPFSTTVMIVKPDKVPPVPPVLKSVKSTTRGVEIMAIPSSSEDVSSHQLYRKQKNAGQWELIHTFTGDSLYYVDVALRPAQEYHYTLVAVDEAGLKSEKGQLFSGKLINLGGQPGVQKIQYDINRDKKIIHIKWKYEGDNISKYYVFRSVEDSPITLYKSVNVQENKLMDTNVAMNTTYRYRLKVVFKDGSESSFSDELVIKF
jgi:fibronectin type 3 domain-containing protein